MQREWKAIAHVQVTRTNALELGRVEGDTPTLCSNTNHKLFKGELLVKRFLSVFVMSMFLTSAAFAADAVKEEKKADVKADAKAGEKSKGDAKAGAVKEEKKAEPAKGGEKAKGEAKGDAKASEKAKDAKAGAIGEEKKTSK
ncbi:MAG: hypothetical protein ACXWYD_20295 [Candidatus Binatia bacterium]